MPHPDPSRRSRQVDTTAGPGGTPARWHGLFWVLLAVATPAVWIWPRTAAGELELIQQFWIALALLAAGVALTVIQEFRGVLAGDNPVTNGRALLAYVGLILVVTMVSLIWNPPLSPWFVAVALLPAIPAAVAAVRILTHTPTNRDHLTRT